MRFANLVNAGLAMKQEGVLADGNHPIASAGRGYRLCDANTAPIMLIDKVQRKLCCGVFCGLDGTGVCEEVFSCGQ